MDPELIAALHPPRLPQSFTQVGLADALLAFGLGLTLAGILLVLFKPFWRARPLTPNRRARIKAARLLPSEEGLAALAQIAQDEGLALTEAERRALYTGHSAHIARESLLKRLGQNRGRRR